jgi:hypothetical protein
MKGRDRFTAAEAATIRELLRQVRRAEPGTPQKLLRDQLRAMGFYISDWDGSQAGFTGAAFDDLVSRGLVIVGDDGGPLSGAGGAQKQPGTGRDRDAATPSGGSGGHPIRAPGIHEVATRARSALGEPTMRIAAAVAGAVPDRPGLYAIYASNVVWRKLGLGEAPDDRPLYVGKAEDSLVSRDLNTHFATGKTGRSSPRRSFAALLAHDLKLVAMPRRPANPEPKKWTNYALEKPGDGRLTHWMCANLQLAVWVQPTGAPLAAVESALMGVWLPPLNLTGVTTPWTAEVKAARAVLAEEAKRWARDHSFDVD